jgi:type I restriction enzyme M protein
MKILVHYSALSLSNLDAAKTWIGSEKPRLKNLIQEDLDFKLLEIEEYYAEDIEIQTEKVAKAKNVITDKEAKKEKPTKTHLKAVETAQNALYKLTNEKNNKITAAQEQAEKERQAIEAVEQELITMLQDPEQRKRYFAIADMEELDENEFNLNIPRYVDTFEPEEEIDLKQAIAEFKNSLSQESALDKSIDELLKVLS